MRKIVLLFLFLFLGVLNVVFAENELQPSRQLTISEGLAHNGVTSVLEDSKGYLWVGTFDGLCRYDGYKFTTFRNTFEKKTLVSNRVRSLLEAPNGNIWIGTDEGISIYDYTHERFYDVFDDPGVNGPIVIEILYDDAKDEMLCITETHGVLIFKSNGTLKQRYTMPKTIGTGMVSFNGGIRLSNKRYILTSTEGLFTLNPENGDFTRILEQRVAHTIDAELINKQYFLICGNNGLMNIEYINDDEKYKFRVARHEYKGEPLRCISKDNNKQLWIGKYREGFIKVHSVNKLINNEKYHTSSFDLESELVRSSCITPTTNRGCWVGTFNRGLYRFDTHDNPFKYYSAQKDAPLGITSNEVLHITKYSWYQVFISAHSGGIGLFNIRTGKFEPLPFNKQDAVISRTGITTLDGRGNIWVRMAGNPGICRIPNGKRNLERVHFKKYPSFNRMPLHDVVDDQFGYLWFGGERGLYRLKFDKQNQFQNIEYIGEHPDIQTPSKLRIRRLYVDPHHNYLWVATKENGLLRISTARNVPLAELKIKNYRDENGENILPSDFVSSVIRLPNDDLWIGMERGGIAKLIEDEDNTSLVGFSEKDGLSNNVVKTILYDDDYNLWISTNIGLNKFNTKENAFRIFKKEDGLPFEDFSNAGRKMKNGTLMFSGLNGFCYFNPKDVPDTEDLPAIDFGALKLYNETILPGDTINNRVLLEKRLNDKTELVLNHDENVFAIEVNSLHYSTPINHYLRYQLLPINKDWLEVSSDQKEVHYNGLPPGEYTFRIMASNSLGKWTEPKELTIIIKRPYWLTPLAFVIYFLLVAMVVYVIIIVNLRMQKLRHNLEIESLEKEKGKEVNAAKLRFFSNISHEIKTPITLISGPVNVLAERFKHHPDVSEKLNIVRRQSRKISQLVDQVHDFQRADANQLKLNYSIFSFDNFVRDIQEDFSFLAQNEGKTLRIERQEYATNVKADEDKISKVINNLLSNAFKFTQKDDEIVIDYYQHDNNLIVKVSDNGKGIDSNDLPHIFERFFQSQKMKKEYSGGSGIGLAFSKRLVEMHYGFIEAASVEGKGTTMTIKLPIITEETIEDQLLAEERALSSEKNFVKKQVDEDKSKLKHIKVDEALKDTQIFLVEDNTEMRLFVEETLSNFFEIKTFVNGKECLNALEEEWPDLIVSDVLMPEMNGFELTRAIKSDIKTSHIPVILLTACTVIDDQIKGIREGADAYIMKPFDIEHLVTRITSLLGARTKLRERFEANLPLQLKKEDESAQDMVFLEKLYQLMNDNLSNLELDLNQFARELYLNRTHFYQKVKALTNQTPYELLKSYRLKKAAELLVNEKLPVNEVIDATGFKSRSHFIKSFKERYNTTPGKYAQGIEENM